eukprot:gnl/TRDRNA2_/TRDRNA2_128831_c0_seq2.p1 gnl/TRDRNA2_/TRDRNA2_128831_c0~~gnl/TRDRNA2_/TRDRNA2_128831_c0_seq2.p1  ORF type:complete len:1008 (+),score=235.61 gnl/TRDRNA2_/TRDRNA2_128831_c0_seq2:223-3024(+)
MGESPGALAKSSSSSMLVGSSPSRANHEMLKHSLQESQRRCENLNAEMLRQAQASEELLRALTSTREANKRLTDQVRQQAEEITTLSRQRIGDQEQLEELRKRHRVEDDLLEKDAQRRLASIQEDAQARCQRAQYQLHDRMRFMQGRLQQTLKDVVRLKAEHADHKRTVKSNTEAMQQLMQQAERGIMQRLDGYLRQQSQFRTTSEQVVRDLEARIATEHEMRVNEVSSWSHRHALLSGERDDLQSRLTRDVSQLTSHIQVGEKSREEERRAWVEERSRLQQVQDELAHQRATADATIEQLRRETPKLEAANAKLEQELRGSQQRVTELQRQVRESEDALATSVASNQNLRDQLEDERVRLTATQEAAIAAARDACQQKLNLSAESAQAELARASDQLKVAEQQSRQGEAELAQARALASAAEEATERLRHDLQQSKSELDDAGAMRKALEGQLADAKEELASDRSKLQSEIDSLEHAKTALEAESQAMHDRLLEVTKACTDRDAERTRISGALEAGIRDRDLRLEERERKLVEARDAAAEAAAEAAVQRQRNAEITTTLEAVTRDATEERRRLEEERHRLEETISAQSRTAQEAHVNYERWRESHMLSLRQVQEETVSKVNALDREKEICSSELTDSLKKLAETQARLEASEEDCNRIRYLLNESQSNISWVKQEKERSQDEGLAIKAQLQEEVKQVSGALESAMRNEVGLTQQLEEATARYQQERQKFEREQEDARRNLERQAAEADQRVERLKTEYEGRIQSIESRHGGELERERTRMDAVLRENDQLRRYMADQRKSSSQGMTALQSQLESHIARLQQHTNELRGDLNRSAAAAMTLDGSSGVASPRLTAPPTWPGIPSTALDLHSPSAPPALGGSSPLLARTPTGAVAGRESSPAVLQGRSSSRPSLTGMLDAVRGGYQPASSPGHGP